MGAIVKPGWKELTISLLNWTPERREFDQFIMVATRLLHLHVDLLFLPCSGKETRLDSCHFSQVRIPAAGALGCGPEEVLVVIARQLRGRGDLLCWIECEGEAIEMTLS